MVIGGGGAVAISYQLLKYLGAKLIDDRFAAKQAALTARFNERLQDLKTEQDRALRHIQSGIDRNVHRAKKLYDKEFEVISEAWQLLDKTWLVANAASVDDFDLADAEQRQMWDSRTEEFYKFSGELDHFVTWNGIFLTAEIAENFERLAGMLRMAFVAITMNVYDSDATAKIIGNFKENGEPIKERLRQQIRERFWSAGSELSGS